MVKLSKAIFIAASIGALAGCATEENAEKTAAADPCLGAAPATGTLIRKNSDCGRRPSEGLPQDVIDQIRQSWNPLQGSRPRSMGGG